MDEFWQELFSVSAESLRRAIKIQHALQLQDVWFAKTKTPRSQENAQKCWTTVSLLDATIRELAVVVSECCDHVQDYGEFEEFFQEIPHCFVVKFDDGEKRTVVLPPIKTPFEPIGPENKAARQDLLQRLQGQRFALTIAAIGALSPDYSVMHENGGSVGQFCIELLK